MDDKFVKLPKYIDFQNLNYIIDDYEDDIINKEIKYKLNKTKDKIQNIDRQKWNESVRLHNKYESIQKFITDAVKESKAPNS